VLRAQHRKCDAATLNMLLLLDVQIVKQSSNAHITARILGHFGLDNYRYITSLKAGAHMEPALAAENSMPRSSFLGTLVPGCAC